METDVLIIGCGPAGVQAAIHSSRRKVSTVMVGKPAGSALADAHIENYMGVPKRSGADILTDGIAQAVSFGTVFIESNVISASGTDGAFKIGLDDGREIVAKAVVLATGISRQHLGIPGEKELYGKGVSYCAVCDCNFYKGRRAVIVGNESEAAVSAEMMTSYASETSWVCWDLTASDMLVGKAEAAGVRMYRSKPKAVIGEGRVEALELEDGTRIPTDGVFIELGARSSADIAMDLGVMPEMDDSVKVDRDCRTEAKGVFACGDITGKPWQLAKAVGEGCVAGLRAADHVKGV